MSSPLNIILFGETGAGKSSLINLIAGDNIAPVSANGGPCIRTCTWYIFKVKGVSHNVWDTRGFDEADTETGVNEYLSAIEQAYRLIRSVSELGGVDLLVLCHREGRITTGTKNNYGLFHKALCETKVPVALVITHLERRPRMEDWWDENEHVFEEGGLKFAAHACVTGLPGHPKSQESKQAIEAMLDRFDGARRYSSPTDEWLRRFLRSLPEFRRAPKGIRRRDLERLLQDRCGLNPRDAQEAARNLRDSDGSSKGLFGQYFTMHSTGPRLPRDPSLRVQEDSDTKISRLEETAGRLRNQLSESQRTIEFLNTRDKDSNSKISRLEETVGRLRNQLSESQLTVEFLNTQDKDSTGKIADLREVNRRLSRELSDSRRKLDSLAEILRAHERKHQCETLYAEGRIIDAALTLLDITKSVTDEVRANGLIMDWIAMFRSRCISKLETIGDEVLNAEERDEAVKTYFTALLLGPSAPDNLLMKWANTMLIRSSADKILSASTELVLPRFPIYRVTCDVLEKGGRVSEAIRCFQQMESELGEDKGGDDGQSDDPIDSFCLTSTIGEDVNPGDKAKWIASFKARCLKTLEQHGDVAMDSSLYDDAVDHYTAALVLGPLSTKLLTKRSKARAGNELWSDSLADAEMVIKLDPASQWGYERMHAALLGAHRYDEAINAYSDMLLKLEQSPDPLIKESRNRYVSPSQNIGAIRSAVKWVQRDAPLVLINTETGRLYNKQERLDEFEANSKFKELVASVMTRHDNSRIVPAVQDYFRYATFSHTWEGAEPLFHEVHQESVQELAESSTVSKLVMFCMTVREAGLRWAWCDTCCINRMDGPALQESLTSMFRWYHNAALTIVHLKGVRSDSELRALIKSLWNTRAWTLQEFFASRVIRFYTEDWKIYRSEQSIYNHKESPVIMDEMASATGVDAQVLLSLRPGSKNVRQKLCLAATRNATRQEDIAYSLFGIFDVSIPVNYGEGPQCALGRLLQEVLTRSGDVTILAWTGKPSGYNSCLPAEIGVYHEPESPYIPSPIDDDQMKTLVMELRASPAHLDSAVTLYDQIVLLSSPRLFSRRLTLSCIMFPLRGTVTLGGDSDWNVYSTMTPALGNVEIKTTEDLSNLNNMVLVHPWLKCLLDPALPSEDLIVDDELFSDPDTLFLSESSPHTISHPDNKLTRALRLFARLRHPFGALLLDPMGHNEYKRVASDHPIVVQLVNNVSPRYLAQMIRTLDIL